MSNCWIGYTSSTEDLEAFLTSQGRIMGTSCVKAVKTWWVLEHPQTFTPASYTKKATVSPLYWSSAEFKKLEVRKSWFLKIWNSPVWCQIVFAVGRACWDPSNWSWNYTSLQRKLASCSFRCSVNKGRREILEYAACIRQQTLKGSRGKPCGVRPGW